MEHGEERIGADQPCTPESERNKLLRKYGHCEPSTPDEFEEKLRNRIYWGDAEDRKRKEEELDKESDWSPMTPVAGGSNSPKTPSSIDQDVKEEESIPLLQNLIKASKKTAKETLPKIPADKNKDYIRKETWGKIEERNALLQQKEEHRREEVGKSNGKSKNKQQDRKGKGAQVNDLNKEIKKHLRKDKKRRLSNSPAKMTRTFTRSTYGKR